MTDRDFWLGFRQGFLQLVDYIERGPLGQKPTTAEIRKWYKASHPGPGGIRAEDVRLRIAKLRVEEGED